MTTSRTTFSPTSRSVRFTLPARSRNVGAHSSNWLDHQPAVTEAIKGVLKENYNYDSTVRPCFIEQR